MPSYDTFGIITLIITVSLLIYPVTTWLRWRPLRIARRIILNDTPSSRGQGFRVVNSNEVSQYIEWKRGDIWVTYKYLPHDSGSKHVILIGWRGRGLRYHGYGRTLCYGIGAQKGEKDDRSFWIDGIGMIPGPTPMPRSARSYARSVLTAARSRDTLVGKLRALAA